MKKSNWMKGLGVVLTLFVFANSAMCFWNQNLVCGIINMVLGIVDIILVVRLFYKFNHLEECEKCLNTWRVILEGEENTDK